MAAEGYEIFRASQRGVFRLVPITCLFFTLLLFGCFPQQEPLAQRHADLIDGAVASGMRSYREGRYKDAIASYDAALKISTDAQAFERASEIHYNMALAYLKQEKYDPALDHCNEALQWAKRNGRWKEEGHILNRMGAIQQERGDIIAAGKRYREALAIRMATGDRLGQARTLANLAYISLAERRYMAALDQYREARAILDDLRPPSYGDLGAVLTQTGTVYAELGQYGRALAFHRMAKTAYEKIGDESGIAGAVNNVGTTWYRAKDYGRAVAAFDKVLAIRRGMKDKTGVAEALNNMGLALVDGGDARKALSHLNASLALARNLGNAGLEAYILDSLGTAHKVLGNYGDSFDCYTRSLTSWIRLGDRNGELVTTGNLGSLFETEGKAELAIVFYKRSINMTEEIRGRLAGLPTAQQRSYLESVEHNYRRLADLLLKRGRTVEAVRVVDLLKVQELERDAPSLRGDAQVHPGVPNLSAEAALSGMYDELQEQAVLVGIELERLRKIREPMLTEDQERRIDELLTAQRQLRRRFIDFAKSDAVREKLVQLSGSEGYQLMPAPIELRNLQHEMEKLNDVAVLLYSLVFKDRIELLLVTPMSPPIRETVAVSEDELNSAIYDFRRSLTGRHPDAIQAARKFHDWLIRPVLPYLEQTGARVIINLPDARLRYIPLAALHDGEDWLIQRFRFFNITAWSLNGNRLNAPVMESRRVLAGAFTRGSHTVNIEGRKMIFSGLGYTKREIDGIAAALPGATTLFDAEFTRNATLSRLNAYSVLHFATHAGIIPGSPRDSFILLGSGETLRLSDLEVEDLHDVDMVVLSACETALDNVMSDGREILGFGHLLEQAGASSSVASLWKVDDEGTQVLMRHFYEALSEENAGKADALRSAQLAMISQAKTNGHSASPRGVELADPDDRPAAARDFSHPYYWAAFIIIGNGF